MLVLLLLLISRLINRSGLSISYSKVFSSDQTIYLGLRNIIYLQDYPQWMKLQMRTVQYFFNLVTSCYLKYQRKPKILKYIQFKVIPWKYLDKENRIYIRVKFTGKKCKTAILFYCFHTAGVLHIYLCFITFWAREHYFIENLKLILKNPNYEIARFIIDQ